MPPKKWSMYPSLHDDVSCLLEEENLYFDFREGDNPQGCSKEYDSHIMGRFTCHNPKCSSKGWSSKKISITIRMYPGAKYNARMDHMRKELHTVSKNGLEYIWRCRGPLAEAKVRTMSIYAKDAKLSPIAIITDRRREKAMEQLTSKRPVW
ncbi:hypothetical protein CIHG_05330 [Coccidioides immitis H538.4]|uniref:3CxxC-type domain-containing protein n=3 Tax=Coccidioides immitis TaxID=5501 RepID=A0A0J8U0S1_COCIT|nr:hypothetical protein CIRG_02110 [Coccidioides immitis RMSCC 2394]KMU79877.1 hypothetical protein CISG_07949 [Coccidioides immitis RMSCC 3703]KMU88159.1 hypothetical protein CIHG_05330 [Coccidioides immitis H538.4]